jgi:hypothetical protein
MESKNLCRMIVNVYLLKLMYKDGIQLSLTRDGCSLFKEKMKKKTIIKIYIKIVHSLSSTSQIREQLQV